MKRERSRTRIPSRGRVRGAGFAGDSILTVTPSLLSVAAGGIARQTSQAVPCRKLRRFSDRPWAFLCARRSAWRSRARSSPESAPRPYGGALPGSCTGWRRHTNRASRNTESNSSPPHPKRRRRSWSRRSASLEKSWCRRKSSASTPSAGTGALGAYPPDRPRQQHTSAASCRHIADQCRANRDH